MFLELTDEEQLFLVEALNDIAEAFGDDDEAEEIEALVELVEAESNLKRSQLAAIDEALSSYNDRHSENFSPDDLEIYDAVADKLGAALGN